MKAIQFRFDGIDGRYDAQRGMLQYGNFTCQLSAAMPELRQHVDRAQARAELAIKHAEGKKAISEQRWGDAAQISAQCEALVDRLR